MSALQAYGKEITSIFQLFGDHENDITRSIAWAMCKCPAFTKSLIDELLEIDCDPENIIIKYQKFDKDNGITDLEITDNRLFYAIIEAKKGWILPGASQLDQYSKLKDFKESKAEHKMLISMSECSEYYADAFLPFKEINGIPVKHLSWKHIYDLAEKAGSLSRRTEKNILNELKDYLGGIMSMQSQMSNLVYVVSLSDANAGGSLSYLDVVKKKGRYYHPVGGSGWPKEPPNYIAFRYDGRLQSIHHIENYEITRNLHNQIPELPDMEENCDHYIYTLGPAIIPSKTVKTGNILAAGRRWAMLDTLLTSDTIYEACEITKQRRGNTNE